VRQLPPATSAWLENGQLQLNRYWDLPTDEAAPGGLNLVEDVAALLEDAVRLRLRSDVPVGVLLSGGLDSSGVTCLAARLAVTQLSAFSTIDANPPEEAAGIDAVLALHPGLRLHRDSPDEGCLDTDLADCLWHQEEPFADGSMLAHFRLMRMARTAGVRVLLTGQAADEVFAGYPGFLAMQLGGLLRTGRIAEAIAFFSAKRASGQKAPLKGSLGHALPERAGAWLRRKRARNGLDWLAEGWDRPSSDVIGGYGHGNGDPVNDALRSCLRKRTLPGFLHYEDRNSMAFGVETRIPFLDHRLVEKVLPLPGAVKLEKARSKSLLRAALTPSVPTTIVSRLAKQGFPAPLSRWLRMVPPVRQRERMDVVAACPMVDCDLWRVRFQRFMSGDEQELVAVWRGLVLALWYQRFIVEKI